MSLLGGVVREVAYGAIVELPDRLFCGMGVCGGGGGLCRASGLWE